MGGIQFSVVVPTHNRGDLVAALLESLDVARAAFDGATEVIIVDSSADAAEAAIYASCAAHGARYLRDQNVVCHKRNLALQAAQGDYVLFTDSDCEVPADIFEQHLSIYRSGVPDIGGVLGLTIVTGDLAPVWKTLELDSSFTAAFSFARWLEYAPWGTCTNLSFPREVLLRVNGFDERWPLVVYGEDVDLGLRVNAAGYRIRCNPQVIVKHNSTAIATLRQVFRKKYMTGRADYHLGRKHPDHLAAEFPGWAGVSILTLALLILKSVVVGSPWTLLAGVLALSAGLCLQAGLTARAAKSGPRSMPRQATVIALEAAFEFGRLFESFRHGRPERLWRKFVYVERQLWGERERRIRQGWALLLAFSLLVLLVQ